MRSSRWNKIGIVTLLLLIATVGSSCTYYRKVMARMNLVDGAQAYNQRHFEDAMQKFEKAVSYDPDGTTLESRTAQLFLARTLHSLFAGNRRDTPKAEQAITEYKKALPEFTSAYQEEKTTAAENPDDEKAQTTLAQTEANLSSIVSAVGSLYENLQQEDNWFQWEKSTAENEQLPDAVRSNSYVALAAKEYECASEITDSEEVKKTIDKGGEQVFEFSKPGEEQFAKLKKCVANGLAYAEQAVKLNDESDSAWSYLASLQVQQMRIAEMEGNTEQVAALKTKSETSKAKFEKLAEARRKQEEAEAEAKAKAAGGEVKTSSEEEGSSDAPANE